MEDDQTNEERLQRGGKTYKPKDLNHLAHLIIELLQNDELRDKLGQEGKKFIVDNYSYKRIIQDVENVIVQHINLI